MTAPLDHDALFGLAADPSDRARDELMDAVVTYFCDHPAEPSEQSCGIFCEIVRFLLSKVSPIARERMSNKLSVHPRTPEPLALELAQSDKPEVFLPFLSRSTALKDTSLREFSEKMSNRHRLAIAGRSKVSEGVSAALVKNGDNEVVRTLTDNVGAFFSQETVADILKKSEADANLRKTVKNRGEKGAGFFKQLRSAVKSLLAFECTDFDDAEFKVEELDGYVEKIEEARINDAQCEQKVETVNKKIVKKETTVEEALSTYSDDGQVRETVALLAKRLKLSVGAVRTVYTQKDPAGFAMLCYSLKMDQQTFRKLAKTRLDYLKMDAGHLAIAVDGYRKVTTRDCERFVRILRQSN